MVRRGHITVLAVLDREHAETVEVATVLLPLQATNHLVHQVVDVQEFELDRGVIDLVLQVISDGVAEGGDGTVVVGAAPLTEEVREAVDQDLHTIFLPVFQEQILPRLLAAAVLGVPEPARQRRLLGGRKHHRAGVVMLPERLQECRCKPEIPAHELLHILRPVHPRQIEHKIRLRTPLIQLCRGRVEVVFIYVRNGHAVVAGFAVADVFKLCAEVLSDEALCACHKYLHFTIIVISLSHSGLIPPSKLSLDSKFHLIYIRLPLHEAERLVECVGLHAGGVRGEMKVDGREFASGEVNDALQEGTAYPLAPIGR